MLDIAVAVIIGFFMFMGYRRGLLLTVFGLLSFVVSIALAGTLYPYVAEWLRATPLYTELQGYIVRTMDLGRFTGGQASFLPEDISKLPIPDILRSALAENYNLETLDFLDVSNIEDYIGGFIAGVGINILSMLLVFLAAMVVMKLVSGLLNVVGRLPVIKTFNRAGGLLIGIAQGLIIVWVCLAAFSLFFLNPTQPQFYTMLEGSVITRWLYENNPLMRLLAGIS
jgi:uncharacterized membrane protein required for colicin V production